MGTILPDLSLSTLLWDLLPSQPVPPHPPKLRRSIAARATMFRRP
jgi:hypothetical protein